MNARNPPVRPRKRRQRDWVLREDDVETADAIIVESVIRQTDDGPVEDITKIPYWIARPELNTQHDSPQHVENNNQPQDIPQDIPQEIPDFQEDQSAQGEPRTQRVGEINAIENIFL